MGRLNLYLEHLSLDEVLFLEQELQRRKAKFRKEYSILAVQTEQRLLTAVDRATLGPIMREMRRHLSDSAATGGGIMLAYSPETSLLMFRDVEGASKSAAKLLSGLAEVNGRIGTESHRITLKLGLATGMDTVAAGSARSIRQSALVKRAGQCAWKCPAGSLLMDEQSAQKWTVRSEAIRLPIEVEGSAVYRVVPDSRASNTSDAGYAQVGEFLSEAVQRKISTLKYSLLREEGEASVNGAWSKPVTRVVITLEYFDHETGRNANVSIRCALTEYADKVEQIRRMVSDRGLGLVKHEEASQLYA